MITLPQCITSELQAILIIAGIALFSKEFLPVPSPSNKNKTKDKAGQGLCFVDLCTPSAWHTKQFHQLKASAPRREVGGKEKSPPNLCSALQKSPCAGEAVE